MAVKDPSAEAPMEATLGSRIRALRHQKDWSLEQLAAEAGVSKGFLSEIENDRSQPGGRMLIRLARALGASVDYVVQGQGAAMPQATATVSIPEELAALAIESNWTFARVRALAEARAALIARRSDAARKSFTKAEWREFAERLAPFLDEEG
jgi:transcriptional regulator with XRE-family HTH domain